MKERGAIARPSDIEQAATSKKPSKKEKQKANEPLAPTSVIVPRTQTPTVGGP